jgi:hypothetical protein
MKGIISIAVIICIFISSFSISGCYYDIEEELYGGACDSSNVTYSATIKRLLVNYGCLGCHVGGTPSGGINLETHANVKAKVIDGTLFGAINHSPGFSPMPKGGNKMSQCDINKVKAWIDAGTPNN